MLLTGNRNRLSGFTLVEVMAATAVLSLAALLIYETLFRSLDTLNYCVDYLDVISWADTKIWQAQNDLARFGGLVNTQTSGSFELRNRNFRWDLSLAPLNSPERIYNINLALAWRAGSKSARMTRSAFSLYRPKDEKDNI